jgi:hypothetical protein
MLCSCVMRVARRSSCYPVSCALLLLLLLARGQLLLLLRTLMLCMLLRMLGSWLCQGLYITST